MAEYTYSDVIIDPDDPRVELGKEYYFGNNPGCLLRSISQLSASEGTLVMKDSAIEAQSSPFMSSEGEWFVCIIRKKEPEKKYVPFDLSKEEDRAKLRGEYLIQLYTGNFSQEEKLVVGFSENTVIIGGYDPHCFNGHELLGGFTFLDGSPCGRLEEEE